jgi:uncharacterized protein (TIGR03086 family)
MSAAPPAGPLNRALAAVDPLIAGIADTQWSAPTPCTEWTVRDVVAHLVGVNRMITASLRDQPPPTRGDDLLGDDPLGAYRSSATALRDAIQLPGALDRTSQGPMGPANGAERLKWRTADLLGHGWDIAKATGQPLDLPADLVEESLAFLKKELGDASRGARFGPPQPVAADAPAIDRLVAFSGRPLS